MIINLILYLLICLLVGLTTFGGGQVFYLIFNSFFYLILTPVVASSITTATDWNWGFVFSSATPGPLSIKLSGYLAILVSQKNIAISLIMIVLSYIFIMMPATIIMILVDRRISMRNDRFKYISMFLKPTIAAILTYLVIEIIFSIVGFDMRNVYNNTKGTSSYSFINFSWQNIVKISIYFVTDFILSLYIFLKHKNISPIWVILGSGLVGFLILYFI